MGKRKNSRAKGLGLLEVLIGTSMLTTLMYGTLVFMRSTYMNTTTQRAMSDRDRIFEKLSRSSLIPANLIASAAADTSGALNLCLQPGAATDCTANVNHEFTLIDNAGTAIAGQGGSPVLYDASGNQCAAASPLCPFAARVAFIAQCLGGGGTCQQAVSLRVIASLQPVARMPNTTMDLAVRTAGGAGATLQVSDIISLGAKGCPAGTRYVGNDAFGNPSCVADVAVGCTVPNTYVTSVNFANQTVGCAALPAGPPPLVGNCSSTYILSVNATTGAVTCAPNPIDRVFTGRHSTNVAAGVNGPGFYDVTVSVPVSTVTYAMCAVNQDVFNDGGWFHCRCSASNPTISGGTVTFHNFFERGDYSTPGPGGLANGGTCDFHYVIVGH